MTAHKAKKKKKSNSTILPTPSRWHLFVALLCFVAMALHFILIYTTSGLVGPFEIADLPLIAVMVFGGVPLAYEILSKVFQGDFGTDLLAAISLITAAFLDQYLAGVLIVLMLSGGQALETYAMRKASSVLLALAERMPEFAHRKVGSHIEDIPLADIQVGDLIVIYPHEASPVDGIVVEGHSAMDEAYLTGEPYQISKAPGAAVLSGAINGESVLVIQAERIPSDSRYAKILSVMQDAEQKRPVMRRLADQIGAVFSPIALVFGAGVWIFTGDPDRFLAVLVVATPCPLLIAIPVTVISAISMAAKRGIIIKDPTVLERLPLCTTAIFDKTGTLTYGQPELTEIIAREGEAEDRILQDIASLERYSKHPLASAFLAKAQANKLYLLDASEVSEKPGQGLVGKVNGKTFQITHRKFIAEKHPKMLSLLPKVEQGLECVVLENGAYLATFRFRDMPRAESEFFIRHLGPSHQFKKVMLVSGDRASEVSYLGKLLGISDLRASQSPEQKLEIVRAETKLASTLFMGDGVNDAPALTAATVGLAFGGHTNVTAEAAGAVILNNSLVKVDELIHLSLSMRKIALQSALGGMFLSVIGMGFASVGYITPVVGALLQEVIDVLAIVNALRLIWGKPFEIDLYDAKK